MLTRLHQRHDDSNRERRLIHQMMGPDHFAMMQYNNQLRMQQAFIARQNWQLQLQMLYGNNYTGAQAQQFTANAAGNQQQRFGSVAWRGGISPFGTEPPGNAGMRPFPRSPAGFRQDMEGGPSLRPRTRNERLAEYATQQSNDAGYQPYAPRRRIPPAGTGDANEHLTVFGRRPDPDQPAQQPPPRRQRGRDNGPTPPRVRNPDYVAPEEQVVTVYQQPFRSRLPDSLTRDIRGTNPETGQPDISRSYRDVRFWEQGRPRTVEQAGVPAGARKYLESLRNGTGINWGNRLQALYLAHLMEELYLYMARNPGGGDRNARELVNRFNHIHSEVAQVFGREGDMTEAFVMGTGAVLDSRLDSAGNFADEVVITVAGGRLGADQTGYSITMPDGRVIRGAPQGSVGGRGGNGGVNYTGTGGAGKQRYEKGRTTGPGPGSGPAGKQQYEKNRTAGTDQERKKTAADSSTSIKSGNENLKQSQEEMTKLNKRLEEFQNQESKRKETTGAAEKELADLVKREGEFDTQLSKLADEGTKLQASLKELMDPDRTEERVKKIMESFPAGGDPMVNAVREFQAQRKDEQNRIMGQIAAMKNTVATTKTQVEQVRNQSAQLRIRITTMQTELKESQAQVAAIRKQQQDLKKSIDAMEKQVQETRKKNSRA